MEVYVKESLHVLDYKNNIVDTIFLSNDNITAGYAYNITITEANTGYSDLKFEMPNMIIDDQGNKIHNPKLALLTPLVKLRYRREVYYTGTEPITVREPQGYGDKVVYVDRTYSNKYPDNLIEDYVMDYIVQPVDRKRNVLRLDTQFTAIDYPRFNLSKKKVGLTIDDNTLTEDAWTLFENKPMDVPGTIKYQQWTQALSNSVRENGQEIPLSWDPKKANNYPLNKENIIKLLAVITAGEDSWPYGLLGTAFYWPIVSTDRFEGKMYEEGGFLVLQMYDFYAQATEGIDPDHYVDRYSWEWTQLYEMDSYLTPNNARNYLHHILNGTNWSVGEVDVVKTDIPNPSGEGSSEADSTCSLSVSNGNCYNAITAVCKGLQLYPVFDCIKNTVSLKVFAGKNYGLVYRLGSNLTSNQVKMDGEKVITKLYVSGGKDYNGDANINIGDATRSYVQYLTGMYKSSSQLPTTDVAGYWAIVDPALQDIEYWKEGSNRQVYFYINQKWVLGTNNGDGTWSYGEYIVDAQTGAPAPWDPNDQMYINMRSPYGANYILNFKWMYDNKWIRKDEILNIYQYEKEINNRNLAFIEDYTANLVQATNEYNMAVNNYEIALDEHESTLNAMMNKYYVDDTDISKGMKYCFHVVPKGTYPQKVNGKTLHYIKLFHCYECGYTEPIIPGSGHKTKCPECNKSTDFTHEAIHIPVYGFGDCEDFEYSGSDYTYGENDTQGTTPRYDPHLKGHFQRLITGLNRADDSAKDQWTISDYEQKISIIELINYKGGNFDGYNYTITDSNGKNYYVRSVSGQIEVWNESVVKYIKAYGKALDYKRKMEGCKHRLEELQEEYDSWKADIDRIQATEQEWFGDFIIEGNYTNDEQPYSNLLFKEGMEASDKFCIPKVTYNLDVIDSSGLIEYRQPTKTQYECTDCDYVTYSPMTVCERCGSKSIWTTRDTYNDLVRMLHSVGQIVPKAGDYATIYDEPMGMFGVPGLITEISRTLDNPVNNKIKIDTAYTDDEELVGNIITATNTVLNNSDIYARTAVINADGTIDSKSIKNSIDNPNANISIVGTSGSILLSGSGLRCTDPGDPSRAMKYAGNGVFKTTTLSESGEGTVWEKMMTPDGINATYINAGSIDTNKLTITSGLNGTVLIDQYGLAVKNNATRGAKVSTFNKNTAKSDASYPAQWSADNNIASFIGVDASNSPLIFTKGFLVAEEGSNIAGWITDNNSLYKLNGTKKQTWLSPNGINGTVNGTSTDYSLYINGKFGVTPSGVLHATGADISGKIVCNSDSTINGSLGQVAADSVTLSANGISGKVNNVDGTWAIYSKGNFGVTTGGILYTKGAQISGYITANSLKLVEGGSLSGISYNDLDDQPNLTVYISKDGVVGSTPSEGATGFKVSSAGLLQASNAIIYGTIYASGGRIGGWNLSEGRLMGQNNDGQITGLAAATYPGDPVFFAGGPNPWDPNSNWKNTVPFYVTNKGQLKATSAIIKGEIKADSLTLADGIQIGNSHLKSMTTYVNGKVQDVIDITADKVNFSNLTDGTTQISGSNITTGTINGITLISDNGTQKVTIASGHVAGTRNGNYAYDLVTFASGGKLQMFDSSGNMGASFTASGANTSSDIRYKKHIRQIEQQQSLFLITNLNPIEYDYDTEERYRGLSAQQVEEIIEKLNLKPQIYTIDEHGRYSLRYTEFIPDLINCIKYLQAEIEKLKKEED